MFSLQSAPPFRLASAEAGEGCQQEVTVTPIDANDSLALLSAYFPTPTTNSMPRILTTSLR